MWEHEFYIDRNEPGGPCGRVHCWQISNRSWEEYKKEITSGVVIHINSVDVTSVLEEFKENNE